MMIGNFEVPDALKILGPSGLVAVFVMWWLRKPSRDAAMAMTGYKELSAAQKAFMADVQAEREKDRADLAIMRVEREKDRTALAECKAEHAECRARCASLEARVMKLEASE